MPCLITRRRRSSQFHRHPTSARSRSQTDCTRRRFLRSRAGGVGRVGSSSASDSLELHDDGSVAYGSAASDHVSTMRCTSRAAWRAARPLRDRLRWCSKAAVRALRRRAAVASSCVAWPVSGTCLNSVELDVRADSHSVVRACCRASCARADASLSSTSACLATARSCAAASKTCDDSGCGATAARDMVAADGTGAGSASTSCKIEPVTSPGQWSSSESSALSPPPPSGTSASPSLSPLSSALSAAPAPSTLSPSCVAALPLLSWPVSSPVGFLVTALPPPSPSSTAAPAAAPSPSRSSVYAAPPLCESGEPCPESRQESLLSIKIVLLAESVDLSSPLRVFLFKMGDPITPPSDAVCGDARGESTIMSESETCMCRR
eukprot:m.37674 g.37674  ORF g.37674 m.37674 type:complete len:378 (-) comp5564_c0_seq2:261-1394(-)